MCAVTRTWKLALNQGTLREIRSPINAHVKFPRTKYYRNNPRSFLHIFFCSYTDLAASIHYAAFQEIIITFLSQ